MMWERMLEFNVFPVKFYLEAWFQSPLAASAASANDLRLYNNLRIMLPATTGAALSKVVGSHLWYLNKVMIALAFFDSAVSSQMKRETVKAMRETPGSDDPPHRILLPDPTANTLADFAIISTIKFFQQFNSSL